MSKQTDVKWLQKLQLFLDGLLKSILPEDAIRYKYLEAKPMEIWSQAFTHETFSSTDNYEDLEYIGDAILKAAFPQYLKLKFPHLHKGEYTELNVAYMSKMSNAEIAQQMGLGPYIRVSGLARAILNIEADVFESFFGALNDISNLIQFGSGFAVCYNMMMYLFKDVKIDESRGRGSAKTQVLQIFVRFDLPKPEEIVTGITFRVETTPNFLWNANKFRQITELGSSQGANKKDAEKEAYKMAINTLVNEGLITVYEEKANLEQNVEFSIKLRPEHIAFLETYDVQIEDPLIGYAIAATKKEAEFEAYNQAFKTLESYNITTDWAEKAKRYRDLSDPVIAKYVPAALKKLESEGFTPDMYFFIPRKTTTTKGAIVQLIGIRENGQKEVLSYTHTLDSKNSYQNAKASVVEQYINK